MKKSKIRIDSTELLINGSDKLGRHNSTQKAHVHLSRKEKNKNRNGKNSKRKMHALKKEYMH